MKAGDKVVCINNIDNDDNSNILKKGKVYIIKNNIGDHINVDGEYSYYEYFYSKNKFISLKEFRKQKLEKINEGRK